MRDVMCRVKSAARVREEKKLQSCHGIDFARPEKFIGSTVARDKRPRVRTVVPEEQFLEEPFICFLNLWP